MQRELVERAQAGDHDAFSVLVEGRRFRACSAPPRSSSATGTAPRTRSRRRSSPPGRTSARSATRTRGTPGSTGSPCGPATGWPGRHSAGPWSSCTWCPTASRRPTTTSPMTDRRARPARARARPAAHRPASGHRAPLLPRPAAHRGGRASSTSPSGPRSPGCTAASRPSATRWPTRPRSPCRRPGATGMSASRPLERSVATLDDRRGRRAPGRRRSSLPILSATSRTAAARRAGWRSSRSLRCVPDHVSPSARRPHRLALVALLAVAAAVALGVAATPPTPASARCGRLADVPRRLDPFRRRPDGAGWQARRPLDLPCCRFDPEQHRHRRRPRVRVERGRRAPRPRSRRRQGALVVPPGDDTHRPDRGRWASST